MDIYQHLPKMSLGYHLLGSEMGMVTILLPVQCFAQCLARGEPLISGYPELLMPEATLRVLGYIWGGPWTRLDLKQAGFGYTENWGVNQNLTTLGLHLGKPKILLLHSSLRIQFNVQMSMPSQHHTASYRDSSATSPASQSPH